MASAPTPCDHRSDDGTGNGDITKLGKVNRTRYRASGWSVRYFLIPVLVVGSYSRSDLHWDGGADADAQTFAWISDVAICIGIGIFRAKKQEAKRLRTWSRPGSPVPAVSTPPAAPTYRVSRSPSGPIVGNSIRHIYHRPSCEWAGKISARNRITFASASDAQARGYRRCRVCLP